MIETALTSYNYKKYTDLLLKLSHEILNAPDEEEFFQTALAKIGECVNVSRVYLFDYKAGFWHNRYEWVAEGIAPAKSSLQNIDMTELAGNLSVLHCILRGEMYSVANVDEISDEVTRKILLSQGIRSILAVPMYFEGQVCGLFGFDICDSNMVWPSEFLGLIISIANLLSSAQGYFHLRQAVSLKKNQLQDIFDAFSDLIYVATMDTYEVLFINKYIQDLFDLSDLKTKKCYELFQGLNEPCPFCTNQQLQLGAAPYTWYHRNALLDKEYRITDSCILWEDKRPVRLSIASDITEFIKARREEILAKEASLAKSSFLANMSHEIRTPLSGIIGLNNLAMTVNTDPKVNDYLTKIQTSANILLTIINEILDFSKIDSGKLELECHPFVLQEVIDSVQTVIMPNLNTKGLKLNIELAPDIPEVLKGDALRFSQILFNLLSNGVKFTTEGCVCLKLTLVEKTTQTVTLNISVKDTGIGMTESELSKLFIEFSQADSSTTRKYGGTGLGLAIAKRLIELMQGAIKVYSQPNQGTTFEFCVVLGLADAPTLEQNQPENSLPLPSLQGLKVLLAEDNEINQEIASEILQQQGCIVDIASDGLEAVFKVAQNKYDLILMDIQMPNMDGLEATKKIRHDPACANVPIIAMTAHALNTDYAKSIAAGMQDHITKPFNPQDLYGMLSKWGAGINQ